MKVIYISLLQNFGRIFMPKIAEKHVYLAWGFKHDCKILIYALFLTFFKIMKSKV